MQAWEERVMEQNEAREEGFAAGKDEKLLELIQKKLEKGKST
ncbi:Uncharacterised protein [uncultured Roseburia sp.]|nr:Uncharacterised protein [uncultured Roseburia sp.]